VTVMEVLAQAKALSREEQKELAKLLIDMAEAPEVDAPIATLESPPEEHWGKSLNRLMNELGPIELVDSHIEDPVEWVKAQREKERKQRLGDWGE